MSSQGIALVSQEKIGKDEEGEKRGEMKRGEDKKTNRRKDEKGGKRENWKGGERGKGKKRKLGETEMD